MPLCRLECNQTRFLTTISDLELDGSTFVNYIKEHPKLAADFVTTPLNADTAKKSVLQLNVFYSSLTFTQSEEIPKMDMVTLLGSIGGVLGLFMGVSVFSICEMLEIVIESGLILSKKRRKKVNSTWKVSFLNFSSLRDFYNIADTLKKICV